MFVPVIAMACKEKDSNHFAHAIQWAAPTKLAVSCDYYSLEEIERAAEKRRCPMVFLPGRFYEDPQFYKDNSDKFKEITVKGFYQWRIASPEFDFNHWELQRLQDFAKEALEKQTQDVHSKEWQKWLTEQAVYYNNGFYEADLRHGWGKTSIEDSVEIISGGCQLLYSAAEERWDKYSHATAWATVIKRKGKFIVYGEGCDVCGSDWLDFNVFYVFETEEEMFSRMKTWNFKKKESKDVTQDFLNFVNYRPSLQKKFQKIR